MNQECMESLSYPMFATTEEEKLILEKVLSCELNTPHLCLRLLKLGAHYTLRLRQKVSNSLQGEPALEYYLFGGYAYESLPKDIKSFYATPTNAHELRNIWVRKLLTYKGE